MWDDLREAGYGSLLPFYLAHDKITGPMVVEQWANVPPLQVKPVWCWVYYSLMPRRNDSSNKTSICHRLKACKLSGASHLLAPVLVGQRYTLRGCRETNPITRWQRAMALYTKFPTDAHFLLTDSVKVSPWLQKELCTSVLGPFWGATFAKQPSDIGC